MSAIPRYSQFLPLLLALSVVSDVVQVVVSLRTEERTDTSATYGHQPASPGRSGDRAAGRQQ